MAGLAFATPAWSRVGVASVLEGQPPEPVERLLHSGNDLNSTETVTTKADVREQLIFLDGFALSVAPNSIVTIDKIVYEPQQKTSEIVLGVERGVFRFIGGAIGKGSDLAINISSVTLGSGGETSRRPMSNNGARTTQLLSDSGSATEQRTGSPPAIGQQQGSGPLQRAEPIQGAMPMLGSIPADAGGQQQNANAQQGVSTVPTSLPLQTAIPVLNATGLAAIESPQNSPSLQAFGAAFTTPPADTSPQLGAMPGIASPATRQDDLAKITDLVAAGLASPGGKSPEALKVMVEILMSQSPAPAPPPLASEGASVVNKTTSSDRSVSNGNVIGSDSSRLGNSPSTNVTLPMSTLNPAPTVFDIDSRRKTSPH